MTTKRQCLGLEEEDDVNKSTQMVESSSRNELDKLRQLDLSIATSVAGFAGMQTRDSRGNLSPEVWTQHSDDQKIGQLLDAESLKSLLMDQLKLQLEAQKDLVQEVKGEIVIDFIIRYKEAWEKKYRELIQRNYDISQRILSAMHDVVFEVEHVLDASDMTMELLRHQILLATTSSSLPTEEALVRFLFRNPYTGGIFRRAAGKFLQKKEVCNKAGGYSAKQQRDDITQERDEALLSLHQMLNDENDSRIANCLQLIDSSDFVYYISDHKFYAAEPMENIHELLQTFKTTTPTL